MKIIVVGTHVVMTSVLLSNSSGCRKVRSLVDGGHFTTDENTLNSPGDAAPFGGARRCTLVSCFIEDFSFFHVSFHNHFSKTISQKSQMLISIPYSPFPNPQSLIPTL
jgi:hypothetical protein